LRLVEKTPGSRLPGFPRGSSVPSVPLGFLTAPVDLLQRERGGIWAECVFPCDNVIVDGTLYVYYGTADKHIGVATCKADELLEHVRSHPFQ